MDKVVCISIENGPELMGTAPAELSIRVDDLCIAEVDGVTEYAKVISVQDKMPEAAEAGVRVLRRATLQDQAKARENGLMSKMAMETCAAKAKKQGLPMRLVRVRYSFDRAVLVVLFSSEDHVDFREIVKELGAEYRARIEIQQIGVRDEAGIIGGMGTCGRKLCCCTWLDHFESINIKMAKVQGLSLNPNAISGHCGRLKCCLRYESEQYREMGRYLPRQGTRVESPDGPGCVIGRDVLSGRIRLRLDDKRVMDYDARDIRPGWVRQTEQEEKA